MNLSQMTTSSSYFLQVFVWSHANDSGVEIFRLTFENGLWAGAP